MADKSMKKRWISLYVENQVGVLSKISGLFSGKSYNLDSLTVGTTEDPTVSRMTIATVSDDETFEQIKKQLNRMVEVIKVIDFTDIFVRMKEILYIKVRKCTLDQYDGTIKKQSALLIFERESIIIATNKLQIRSIEEWRSF